MSYLSSALVGTGVAVAMLASSSAYAQEKATPQTHPITLLYNFLSKGVKSEIARYDYKTVDACEFGVQSFYDKFVRSAGGDESNVTGNYFCYDNRAQRIVGYGDVVHSDLNFFRGEEVEATFQDFKKLIPVFGVDTSEKPQFDPQP